jgi:hypothetical protein
MRLPLYLAADGKKTGSGRQQDRRRKLPVLMRLSLYLAVDGEEAAGKETKTP